LPTALINTQVIAVRFERCQITQQKSTALEMLKMVSPRESMLTPSPLPPIGRIGLAWPDRQTSTTPGTA
jgi:hypothetical protein